MISVIVPVYNAERYLSETLDSILAQSYKDWECIIVDDGSIDGSKKIIEHYCAEDSRFISIYQRNSGPSAARNTGLQHASGDYIQFLDSDDIFHPKRFELLLKEYAICNSSAILYSDLKVCESDNSSALSDFGNRISIGREVGLKEMYGSFSKDFFVIPGCILFPANIINGIFWDENISHCEDWDYYLNILAKNKTAYFCFIPECLFCYRNTTNSLSKNVLKGYKSAYIVLEKHYSIKLSLEYISNCSRYVFKNLLKFFWGKKVNRVIFPVRFQSYKSIFLMILLPFTLAMTGFYCARYCIIRK